MIHGGKNPQEFLESLKKDWRKEKLLEVRELILDHSQLIEGMNYGMLSYGNGKDDEPLFHLNAQKNYISLYVGEISKIDPKNNMLKAFNLGKGCIRISKSKNIPGTDLKEFIQKAVDLWLQGKDTSC
jgi:uncharacterized protein YdhG (YjbR/CyaY superfamily)